MGDTRRDQQRATLAHREGAANVAKVTMPQLGESVAEGTIGKWLKQPGDHVAKYEPLVEVVTDKVNAEVPSPFEGILREILVEEGATVPNNAEIAVIETADEGAAATDSPAPKPRWPRPRPRQLRHRRRPPPSPRRLRLRRLRLRQRPPTARPAPTSTRSALPPPPRRRPRPPLRPTPPATPMLG